MLEKIKIALFVLVFFVGVFSYSFFPPKAVVVVAFASVLLCGLLFWYSRLGQRLIVFSKESVREFSKVFWPTRKETMQLVLVVFVFTIVVALYLFFVDKLLEWFLYDLILGWR